MSTEALFCNFWNHSKVSRTRVGSSYSQFSLAKL